MIIAPFVSVLILAILVTNCFFGIATYGETKSAAVSEENLQSYVGDYDDNNNLTIVFALK